MIRSRTFYSQDVPTRVPILFPNVCFTNMPFTVIHTSLDRALEWLEGIFILTSVQDFSSAARKAWFLNQSYVFEMRRASHQLIADTSSLLAAPKNSYPSQPTQEPLFSNQLQPTPANSSQQQQQHTLEDAPQRGRHHSDSRRNPPDSHRHRRYCHLYMARLQGKAVAMVTPKKTPSITDGVACRDPNL